MGELVVVPPPEPAGGAPALAGVRGPGAGPDRGSHRVHATVWGVATGWRPPAAAWPRSATPSRPPPSPASSASPSRPSPTSAGPPAAYPSPQAVSDALAEEEAQLAGTVVDEGATASLRERGAELLDRSRDVWHEDDGHPAYARILGDLAPDEARVLMLLVRSGPQPSVDVRSGGPVGRVHSQLIAPGLTMIGARAGCRYVDRVPAYLDNLHRLGLVWFSREQLSDPMEYQVLEAQPDVLEATHSQRFTRVVRRSIHLTPFGAGFCRAALLPVDDASDYPSHGAPDEDHPG